MIGPFNPNIMPIRAIYHYDDVALQWKVTASRWITKAPSGIKREIVRQTFDEYTQALTFVSIFFGNS